MIIGIIGYGKMGQAVEKQAVSRGHSFVLLSSLDPPRSHGFNSVECVIDFSHASVAENAIVSCLKHNIPVVSGTTGWNDRIEAVKAYCQEVNGTFCWSPNFSIGMQITFHINRIMADVMQGHAQYTPEILEIHHTEKKDSPSGTAIALADDIVERVDRIDGWNLDETNPDHIRIEAKREDNVKGIHRVSYISEVDTLSLRHHALSRDGFALGAVYAAEQIHQESGVHSFATLLNLSGTK